MTKYTITKEEIDAIHRALYELNIPCKTKDMIINTLAANPIPEEVTEEVKETNEEKA